MDKDDKITLISSIVAGFLGALSYIASQEIRRAEEEKRKFMEDCRNRYLYEQEQQALYERNHEEG